MFKEIEAVINDSSKHVVRDQRSEALAMLKEMEGVLSDLKVAEEDAASTHNLSNHARRLYWECLYCFGSVAHLGQERGCRVDDTDIINSHPHLVQSAIDELIQKGLVEQRANGRLYVKRQSTPLTVPANPTNLFRNVMPDITGCEYTVLKTILAQQVR